MAGVNPLLITEVSSCRKILHLRISHDRHNRYNEHLVMNAAGRLDHGNLPLHHDRDVAENRELRPLPFNLN